MVQTTDESTPVFNPPQTQVALMGSFVPTEAMMSVQANFDDRQRQAIEMEQAGESPVAIWKKTQLERGQDDRWRFEVNDQGAKLRDDVSQRVPGDEERLADVLDHPGAYLVWPFLEEYKVRFHEPNGSLAGSFDEKTNTFNVYGTGERMPPDIRETILHEMQHAIQAYDKSRGANRRGTGSTVVHGLALLDLYNSMKDSHDFNTVPIHGNRSLGYGPNAIERLQDAYKTFQRADFSPEKQMIFREQFGLAIDRIKDYYRKTYIKSGSSDEATEAAWKFDGPYMIYRANAGETEARNVETRSKKQIIGFESSDQTPESIKALFDTGANVEVDPTLSPPSMTEDIPRNAQYSDDLYN